MDSKQIAHTIRTICEKVGYPPRGLFRGCGLDPNTFSRWEYQPGKASRQSLFRLDVGLGKIIDQLTHLQAHIRRLHDGEEPARPAADPLHANGERRV